MKKVLLDKNSFEPKIIMDAVEVDKNMGCTPYQQAYSMALELPLALESTPINELKSTFIPDSWDRVGFPSQASQPVFAVDTWIKDGAVDEVVQPFSDAPTNLIPDMSYNAYLAGDIDPRYTLAPAHYLIEADQAKVNLRLLQEAKSLMDSDIRAFVKSVTFGNDDASMQAFISSYQLRATNAASYVADGLVAHYTNGLYTAGDPLDTAVKIAEYYNGLLVLIDKDRQVKIATYLATKASLGL